MKRVLALLPSATAALTTAQSIRQHLAERALHIGVGVHVGDVDVRGDDVSGLTANIAARIMGRAAGDETLVSESVRSATLGSGLSFDEAGVAELKGIPEPFALHRRLHENGVQVARAVTQPKCDEIRTPDVSL